MANIRLAKEHALNTTEIRCNNKRIIHGELKKCNNLLAIAYGNFTPNSVELYCKKCEKKVIA
jgi:hypothetical protein